MKVISRCLPSSGYRQQDTTLQTNVPTVFSVPSLYRPCSRYTMDRSVCFSQHSGKISMKIKRVLVSYWILLSSMILENCKDRCNNCVYTRYPDHAPFTYPDRAPYLEAQKVSNFASTSSSCCNATGIMFVSDSDIIHVLVYVSCLSLLYTCTSTTVRLFQRSQQTSKRKSTF